MSSLTLELRHFLGDALFGLDPNLRQDLVDFDDNNWMVWYKWPNASLMKTPKARVLRTFEMFLRLPKEKRLGAAWIIETMEDSQRQLGMRDSDIAAVIMKLLWV